MNQQPEALHWAEWLDDLFAADGEPKAAAAELRRLHEENEALRKQLKHAELAASAEASIVDELQAELQEQARVNGIGSERELKLMAENEALRKDAERYRWLKFAKHLELNSTNGEWIREDDSRFISSHRLCAFGTAFAPYPTLDETIDAAMG